MGKIITLLRKLGVARWGFKKAVYRTGTERPVEFQMPGVFQAEKDLWNRPPENKRSSPIADEPKRRK